MTTLGTLFFFAVFFMAFWLLLFLFIIVVPGAIHLALLNKIAPKFVRRLAGMDEEEEE
jgi:predicted membrane protein